MTTNCPALKFDHFLSQSEMNGWMESFAAAYPEFVRLSSLGKSRGGRNIPMLTITNFSQGDPDSRPGYVIQGVLHADELAGMMVTLEIGRQLVTDYVPGSVLDRVTFYLIPCLNPDGATYVLETGGSEVRSRLDRNSSPNTIQQQDMDGNGLILSMIHQEPGGNLVKDPDDPRLLIARTPESSGPFYRRYPEGVIACWDGGEIHGNGHYVDWNRNFSANWAPEPRQDAAGDYPFSEPEVLALAKFMAEHKRLFAFIGLHGGSGSVTVCPDIPIQDTIDHGDRALFRELGKLGEECTGFPFYIGTEFNLPPWRWMNPLGERHGSVADFGYFHLGLPAMEFELGSMKNTAGVQTLDFEKIQSISELDAKMREIMAWIDKHPEKPKIFYPWKKVIHPQLGEVEIGGFDQRFLNMPGFEEMHQVACRMRRFVERQAAYAPQCVWENVSAECLGDDIWRLRATVANRGKLPTCITNLGRGMRRFAPPQVEFIPGENVELLSEEKYRVIGHLDGYSTAVRLEWFVKAGKSCYILGTVRLDAAVAGVSSLSWTKN